MLTLWFASYLKKISCVYRLGYVTLSAIQSVRFLNMNPLYTTPYLSMDRVEGINFAIRKDDEKLI